MKELLKKIFLFGLAPIIVLGIIEAILPITSFTFRHSEAIDFQTSIPHKTTMYPNISSTMLAVGDLCHHTKYAIVKKEVWKTDKLGFRNDTFCISPDVLLIGDSFVEGSSLSQDETLTSKLQSNLKNKVKVYNMAKSSMSEFDKLLKLGLINKPKLLIFEACERVNPWPLIKYNVEEEFTMKSKMANLLSTYDLNVYLDKALRQFSLKWLKARVNGETGVGIRSIGNSNMYFLLNGEEKHKEGDLAKEVSTIISYKKYCDSLGIKFLFLPIPNKETVYYERVPYSTQPGYLFKLDSALSALNIPSVNTLKLYNNYRKTSDSLLYHLDDTHWNPNGVNIIANELLKNYLPQEGLN